MKAFRGFYFTYKGRSSREFDLVVSTIGGDSSPNFYGISRTMEHEESGGMIPLFKGFKYTCPTIDITLVKMRRGEAVPISDNDLMKINQWLFGDEECHPLVSDDNRDIVYYGAFIKAEKYMNGLRHGYFNVTFQLEAPCAYSPVKHTNILVRDGSKIFEIVNTGNVGKYSYPDIEFILTGENTGLKITNLTLNETMEFTNLPKESHVYCYSEGMKQIICKNNPDLNVRPNFNKQWLRLVSGRNQIKVEGNCDIDIVSQYKIALP